MKQMLVVDYVIDQYADLSESGEALKAIKIKFAFSVLIERHRTSPAQGFTQVEEEYVQYSLTLGTEHSAKSAPFTLIFAKGDQHQQVLNEYLNASIRNMIEYVLDASSTKYVGITGVAFYIFPLLSTGSRLIGYEELIKNKWIYACNGSGADGVAGDEGLCVIECIYIALHEEDYKKLKNARQRIFVKLKQQYEDFRISDLPGKKEKN
jgi:hypothetical protein